MHQVRHCTSAFLCCFFFFFLFVSFTCHTIRDISKSSSYQRNASTTTTNLLATCLPPSSIPRVSVSYSLLFRVFLFLPPRSVYRAQDLPPVSSPSLRPVVATYGMNYMKPTLAPEYPRESSRRVLLHCRTCECCTKQSDSFFASIHARYFLSKPGHVPSDIFVFNHATIHGA